MTNRFQKLANTEAKNYSNKNFRKSRIIAKKYLKYYKPLKEKSNGKS